MKVYHGIIELQYLIDSRRMVLLEERYAEYKKERLRYCCNRAWMKMVGWFNGMLLLSAKCSRPPGRWETLYERRIGEPFNGPGSGWISSYFCERLVEAPPIWKERVTWNVPRRCINRGLNLQRRYLCCRNRGRGNDGRIGNPSSKNQCKRSIEATKGKILYIPSGRWYSKMWKRPRIPRAHSKAGTTWRQWRTSRRTGRVSTDRIKRWRWSLETLFVDSRWLHLSSSHWTSSSTLYAERRNIPYSTEIHWYNHGYLHISGRVARGTKRWLLKCGRGSKFIRFLERMHEVHFIASDVVRGETDKSSSNSHRKENSKSGQSRSPNSIMLEDWEAFIFLIRKKMKKPSNMREKSWKFQWMRKNGTKKQSSPQETEAQSCESTKISP